VGSRWVIFCKPHHFFEDTTWLRKELQPFQGGVVKARVGELPHLIGGVWTNRLLVENNLFLLTFRQLDLPRLLEQLAEGGELTVMGGLCDQYLFDQAGLLELAVGVTAVAQVAHTIPTTLLQVLACRPAVGG
jgi:hypothetical protein